MSFFAPLDTGSHDDHHESKSTPGWVGRVQTLKTRLLKNRKALVTRAQELYLREDVAVELPHDDQDDHDDGGGDQVEYCMPTERASVALVGVWEDEQVRNVAFMKTIFQQLERKGYYSILRRLRRVARRPLGGHLLVPDMYVAAIEQTRLKECSPLCASVKWLEKELGKSRARLVVVALDDEEAARLIEALESSSGADTSVVCVQSAASYFQAKYSANSKIVDAVEAILSSLQSLHQTDKLSPCPSPPSQHDAMVFKGSLSVDKFKNDEAFVSILRSNANEDEAYQSDNSDDEENEDTQTNGQLAAIQEVFIKGRVARGKAIHGDQVFVRVLPREQWQSPISRRRLSSYDGREDGDCHNMETDRVPTGEVVGVSNRSQDRVVVYLSQKSGLEERNVNQRIQALTAVPLDKRLPLIKVHTRYGPNLYNKLFVVCLDGWQQVSQREGFPTGHVVSILGPAEDLGTCEMAVLAQFGLYPNQFLEKTLRSLPLHDWEIPSEEYSRRRDLRKAHRAMSIDPKGSTDVDDVLSVGYLPDGRVEIGCHIADVSYFVKPGTCLDNEAKERSTTVYLPDRRFDMLPSVLSEHLASLIAGTDRLAVSVVWTFASEELGKVEDVWMGRTVIRSKHQLFYEQAQAIIDERPMSLDDEINPIEEKTRVQRDLIILTKVASMWNKRRRANGALEFSSAEMKFQFDEQGNASSMRMKQSLPIMASVAELMIAANSQVAQYISRKRPNTAVLRRHLAPQGDKMQQVAQLAQGYGVEIDFSSNQRLAHSLATAQECLPSHVYAMLSSQITRSLSEAEYVSVSSGSTYHFGLALTYYTHFTSPIRRYADVLVHRTLIQALSAEDSGSSSSSLPIKIADICSHLNDKTRRAKTAQRAANELVLATYLAKAPTEVTALIVAFRENGLLVYVPQFQIQVPVYFQGQLADCVIDRGVKFTLQSYHDIKSGTLRNREGTQVAKLSMFQSLVVDIRAKLGKAGCFPEIVAFTGDLGRCAQAKPSYTSPRQRMLDVPEEDTQESCEADAIGLDKSPSPCNVLSFFKELSLQKEHERHTVISRRDLTVGF